MYRAFTAADRRAALAALQRPEAFDRYLLIEDADDDATFAIRTVVRERSPRSGQVQP